MTNPIDEDDDLPSAEDMKQIADQINELMGGSAGSYALKSLGEGMFAMIFDDADMDAAKLQERLEAAGSKLHGGVMDYPEANPANMFVHHGTLQ